MKKLFIWKVKASEKFKVQIASLFVQLIANVDR